MKQGQDEVRRFVAERIKEFGFHWCPVEGFSNQHTGERLTENHVVCLLKADMRRAGLPYEGKALQRAVLDALAWIRRYFTHVVEQARKDPASHPAVIWVDHSQSATAQISFASPERK